MTAVLVPAAPGYSIVPVQVSLGDSSLSRVALTGSAVLRTARPVTWRAAFNWGDEALIVKRTSPGAGGALILNRTVFSPVLSKETVFRFEPWRAAPLTVMLTSTLRRPSL